MADIMFEIEGQDAVAATKELLSTEGLSGDWKVAIEDKTQGKPTVTTVATVVAIVGGTLAIAEQIRKWYEDYKKGKAGKKIEKVLLIGRNGERILLKDATIEQIKQILDS